MIEAELIQRLEKLERDNRRLKRLGVAALVLTAAFGAVYAARPIPDIIKAHAFVAVDAAGVGRVAMYGTSPAGPVILLGLHRVPGLHGLMAPDVSIDDTPSEGPGIQLTRLGHPKGTLTLSFSPSGEPTVSLNDANGFAMDLGGTRMVATTTGATQRTSAASIVMFGNDKKHHVIWRAP